MKIFFVSDSVISVRDEQGNKIANVLDENNSFLFNVSRLMRGYEKFVFISNDPNDYQSNDQNAQLIANAFEKQLHGFSKTVILDNRTKLDAKLILDGADLIYLQGGVIAPSNKFLHEIDFVSCTKNSNAVIIGKSAGAMNLCKTVYNYPETDADVGSKKWYQGMGFLHTIIIPHFHREKGNEYVFGNFDIMNDYYIPDSHGRTLCAIENGSYILLENNQATVYGETYFIQDGKITKICNFGERTKLK